MVVDASVAVTWFVREDGSDEVRVVAESGARLLAPVFIRLEVASALSKKNRASLVPLEEIEVCLRQLPRLFDELIDLDAIYDRLSSRRLASDGPRS